MINFSFSTNKNSVQPQEAIDLYLKLGWGKRSQYSTDTMERALQNSSLIVSVTNEDGKLIGLTRCLSDGVFHTSIADIMVDPDYQNQGIGKSMMNFVRHHCGHTGIFIDCYENNEKFFEKCGYKKRNMSVLTKRFIQKLQYA